MKKLDRWRMRSRLSALSRHCMLPRWLALTMLCAASTQTVAQSSPCHLQLSEAALDYGAIARTELVERQNSQGKAALAKRSVTLSAVCESSTPMEIEFTSDADERASDPANVTYRVLNAQLDGNAVQLADSGAPETVVSVLKSGDRIHPRAPSPGRRLTIQLEVEPALNATPTWASREGRWQAGARFHLYTHGGT